jgi:adenylate cyclase, class 2
MARDGGREVEIKLALQDAAEGRRKLRAGGFRVSRRRVLECNLVFDTAASTLRGEGRLLRLRRAGNLSTLTFKGPAEDAKHKSREELEVQVSDGDRTERILRRLGFHVSFRYCKFRTEYRGGEGQALLDETPMGAFLELEGPPRWIDRTARKLGYPEESYITRSYIALWQEFCRGQGREPAGDMVFAP